jgi:N6-L-threonylcarbamoyladenine synthase
MVFLYPEKRYNQTMNVLGIETSCDETAVAVVRDDRTVLSNLVLSQIKEHAAFGGVVPEVAARAHLDHLDSLIRAALQDAKLSFGDLGGVAATCGPGLIGGVMVGMMAGKALAAAHSLPFVAVNHLEAHALTPRLTDNIEFPYLLLLVSGGHTQILAVEDVGRYRQFGTTIDDAMGECFDKAAKLMGLPFPGGPHIERMAAQCADIDAAQERFPLPRPMKGRKDCMFSFSGMKTAVRTHIDRMPEGPLNAAAVADLAASFQTALAETVVDRCENAITLFRQKYKTSKPVLVASGGVAANNVLRELLGHLAEQYAMAFCAPPVALCSDNGAMIAWTGIERLRRGMTDTLDVAARPRWPLDPESERMGA